MFSPDLSTTDSVFRAQLAPLLGSFWTSVFSDREQVAQLLGLSQKTAATQMIRSMINNMAGNSKAAAMVENMEVSFRDKDVVPTGMQLVDDPDLTISFEDITAPQASFNLFRINYFVLPVGSVIPFSIEAVTGKLAIGVDFFVVQNQFIFFRQDPRILFPSRIYSVSSGRLVKPTTAVSFLAKIPIWENTNYVVNYLRNKQTPKTFQMALAVAGELQILRKAQKLLAAVQTIWGTIYTFENETLRVKYDHTPLVPGNQYPADYIVGDGVRVVSQTTGQQGWWRSVDWQGGISLDPILNDFRGLSLLNATTVAYSAGSDPGSVNGSKLHSRLSLTDNFFLEEPYWNYVGDRETSMGIYLNSLLKLPEDTPGENTFANLVAGSIQANILNAQIGLPPEQPDVASLPNSKLVNAMDVFFQALLADTAFAVVLDHNQIQNVPQLYAFLAREMMIGGVPIIFDAGPDLQVDNAGIGDSLGLTVIAVPYNELDLLENTTIDPGIEQVFLRALPVVVH